MVLSILALVVFRVPPAYALVTWFDMGATGVWYGITFSNVAILLVAGAWFLRGTWTESVVDEEEGPPGPSPHSPDGGSAGTDRNAPIEADGEASVDDD